MRRQTSVPNVAPWIAVALLCLVGCPSSPPPGPPTPPSPPANSPSGLAVTRDSDTELLLTWAAPAISFDGYLLEMSVEGGPFEQIGSDLLPSDWKGVYLTFHIPMPELLHLQFRLTAMRQGQATGPGATAAYTEPIHSPELVNAHLGPVGVSLQLGGRSAVADRYHVQRNDGRVVDLPLLTNNYVFWDDSDVVEGGTYRYTVTLSNGVLSSNPVTSDTVVITLLQPGDLAALSTDAGQIHLTWTNRSRRATDYLLQRWSGIGEGRLGNAIDLVHLSPGTGVYDDAVAPGVYSYQFTISDGMGNQVQSQFAPAITAPSGSLSMSARVIAGQLWRLIAPDGGVFTVTGGNASSRWILSAPSGATLASGPQEDFASNFLVLDSRGVVHGLLRETMDGGAQVSLRHVWYGGAGWRSEPTVTATPFNGDSRFAFAISTSGGVQVAWRTGQDMGSFAVAEQQAGGGFSVVQPDAGLSGDVQGTLQLVMGQPRPHLLFPAYLYASGTFELIDLFPDPSGGWSTATFPLLGGPVSVAVLGETDGGFAVSCPCNFTDAGAALELSLVRRNASGWDAPEGVGPFPFGSNAVIGASHGEFMAIATEEALYTHTRAAAWERTDFPPTFPPWPEQVGYIEDAGVYVLLSVGDPFSTGLLVEEP